MGIGSLGFLIGLCLGVAVFHLTPWRWLRRLLLVGLNLAFLAQFMPTARGWKCMAIVIVGSYLGLRLLKARPFRGALTLFILLCVNGFVWVKQYPFAAVYSFQFGLPNLWLTDLEMIGYSYILFRLIHMAVDQWQDQLEPYSLLSYVGYQLNLLTLVAGPIQRYNDFHKFWVECDSKPRTTHENLLFWNRVATGTFKMAIIAPAIKAGYVWAANYPGTQAQVDPVRRLLAEFYGYPLYLYFNFSGYTDVAVAAAQLLGLELPENFNHPFLARNVIDFWNRWHMSLTHWVRDYVFMTSYKAVAQKFPRFARQIGYGLIFVSLLVVGLWHGTTYGFAVFGALHGLAAATNQAYGDVLRAWLGPVGVKRYLKSAVVRVAAIVLTFHFVCFTFLFFSLDMWAAQEHLQAACLGLFEGTSLAWGLLWMACASGALLLWMAWQQGTWRQWVDRAVQGAMGPASRLYVSLITQTALVTLWLLLCWAAQEPEVVVVYQRF